MRCSQQKSNLNARRNIGKVRPRNLFFKVMKMMMRFRLLTWLELVSQYVVLLEEDVLAPVELGLVLVPPVEVAIQANHP